MKQNLFLGFANFAALFFVSQMSAQNFQTMPIQSGFTEDVIANGTGSSSVSTSADVDGVSFAFVAKGFQATSASTPITYGLPADGLINSVVTGTPGLNFQLADLNAPNSLKLITAGQSGTLTFTTPVPAFRLYMLSTSGSGTSVVNVLVNFTDGSSQLFSNQELADWYGGTNYAIQGIGRINRNNDNLESSTTNPRLYQAQLNMDTGNQTKPIQSVTVSKVSGSGIPNIFAFSADAYSDCAAPTLQPVASVTPTTVQVSWVANSSTVTSYDIYYSTTNTPPASGATPSVQGISNAAYIIDNLNPNTNYYYWVRANCSSSTGQSVWSFSGTFKTACGAVASLFENFDSYGIGSSVPDCWNRIAGTGSQTITSTSPASGTRNIYQYTGSTATPTYVVLPEFTNVNSGANQLRFKARVSSGAPGSLIVGYVTDPTDAGTFVELQSVSITNTSYASNAEYTVQIPSTLPANARLAIRSANDGKSYYWDDIYWETSQLSTSEVIAAKKKLAVHPNPFKEVLYVSEIDKVSSVTISDISGRVVRTIDSPSKEIDLKFLNSGLYLVTLKFKDGSQLTTKAIKQ
ncbi:fibronectin type III domain-containing protein [Chryseobacterium sp. MYb264]|uniref:fibronectin type III domain-containing protein n=1 Tax=Chryseobacterium sp. MYb264 TaxID=2745153 RepID=UPI002E1301DB|nr:fibronectin type III domain-containing protein [Chryseobacterium sp. MYb264]